MNKLVRNAVTACLAALLLASGGCTFLDSWFGSPGELTSTDTFDTPAQVLASEAESRYIEGEYEEAADMFQTLKDRYPFSQYALLADLRVGDAYYKSERYDEAALAYDDFIRLHPKNEAVPYAIHQMGMVYYTQMLTPDRDPTFSKKAVEIFSRLLKDYPNSEWAVKARPRLEEATRRLANHDMNVGRFYYNTGRYRAAAGRFKRVLTDYGDVGLYEEAMRMLTLAQAGLTNQDAEEAAEDYERTAPLPGSDHPAMGTVDNGGLFPTTTQ